MYRRRRLRTLARSAPNNNRTSQMDPTSSSLASSAAGSLSQSSLSSSFETSVGLDVDVDVMDCLVQDVKTLSDALNKLTIQLTPSSKAVDQVDAAASAMVNDQTQEKCMQVHQALTGVTRVLSELTKRYDFLQCSEILNATSLLVHAIKSLKFDTPATTSSNNEDSLAKARALVEKLQFVVAECVGDQLVWEMHQYESSVSKLSQSSEELTGSVSSVIHQNGASRSEKRATTLQRRYSTFHTISGRECVTSEEIDKVLQRMDDGVELAFERAKAWSKYCKEILNFVHRRINLESEHAKNVQKLAETTRLAIQEDNHLPLRNIYLSSFKVEHEFFDNCMDTMKRLYEYKYIKPLEARKLEHDTKRKELRQMWERHVKQLNDVKIELRKAKLNHATRETNYRKARESSIKLELNSASEKVKIEKKRKAEEDAMLRSKQAAIDCTNLEDKYEKKFQEVERIKVKILEDLRELIYQCDQTTKACTVAYFQACAGLWAPLPMQYQSLAESTREYVPGVEYLQFVQQLPGDADISKYSSFSSKARANSDDQLPVIQVNGHPVIKSRAPVLEQHASYPLISSSIYDSGDDTSISSYAEVSLGLKTPSITGSKGDKVSRRFSALSEAARTHQLQKVRLPTKCCQCEALTVFQTVQCSECGMSWHRSCLGVVDARCDMTTRSSRKLSIFGVELSKHLSDTSVPLPDVLKKCLNELEARGLTVKGLYRVCGVKTKIEELCEQFEREDVDLSNIHPSIIASVVKLYLRQLPEPLLTNRLYSEFINAAKKYPADGSPQIANVAQIVSSLKQIVERMPTANYETTKALILHLNRLTWFEGENQMCASNLGIVFGPTLLWKEEGLTGPSLNSLMETPTQTRAVELLIENAYEIFDSDPSQDMQRLGIIRRPPAREKHRRVTKSFHLSNPFQNSYTCVDGAIPEEPRRTAATPDLLKHDRSMGSPMSHGGSLEFLDLSEGNRIHSTPIEEVKPVDEHRTVIPILASNGEDTHNSDIISTAFHRIRRPIVRRTTSKVNSLLVNAEPNDLSENVTKRGRTFTDPDVHKNCPITKEHDASPTSPIGKPPLSATLFDDSRNELSYV